MKIHVAVHAVTKLFSRGAGVENVSCDASQHEIVGIAGPNGSGKTTLLRIIAGVLSPTSGSVIVTIDEHTIDPDRLQEHTGLVAPYLTLYDEFTPRELLTVTARLRGMDWNEDQTSTLLERFELDRVRDRIAHGFSSGMMQRLRLAVAWQHRPRLLLLDEPTSNLDEDGIALVKNVIDEQQQYGVLFLASNDPRELQWCSKIVEVENQESNRGFARH